MVNLRNIGEILLDAKTPVMYKFSSLPVLLPPLHYNTTTSSSCPTMASSSFGFVSPPPFPLLPPNTPCASPPPTGRVVSGLRSFSWCVPPPPPVVCRPSFLCFFSGASSPSPPKKSPANQRGFLGAGPCVLSFFSPGLLWRLK